MVLCHFCMSLIRKIVAVYRKAGEKVNYSTAICVAFHQEEEPSFQFRWVRLMYTQIRQLHLSEDLTLINDLLYWSCTFNFGQNEK